MSLLRFNSILIELKLTTKRLSTYSFGYEQCKFIHVYKVSKLTVVPSFNIAPAMRYYVIFLNNNVYAIEKRQHNTAKILSNHRTH